MKEWIGYGLAIIFLITSIVIYFVYDGKLDDVKVKYSNDAIQSSIEASDNSFAIYEFTKYQFEENIIDAVSYSESLQKLINTHEKLILMVRDKSASETNKNTVDLSIKFLEIRKDAYVNIKSSVDLSAENFNTVATNKFQESEGVKQQVYESINTFTEK
jgi:hypothetical protein